MFKALVIGCGNIGSQYDFNNEEIQTHAKAFSQNPSIQLTVFDINKELEKRVCQKYMCQFVSDLSANTLKEFDIVSICTPTQTHFEILKTAINANVKTIICEKPISSDFDEMEKIKEIYENGNSKILVNYIRRFQPAFAELKDYLQNSLLINDLVNINIKYQRGFINNCSHAFDLIEFLFEKTLILKEVKIHNCVYDHFDYDATLSLQALWAKTNLVVVGLNSVLFSYFEIDLYFSNSLIRISDAGNTINIYKSLAVTNASSLSPLALYKNLVKEDCLKNYMEAVVSNAINLSVHRYLEDNFLSSINLNQNMLKLSYKNI
jgi:hypothetical protein